MRYRRGRRARSPSADGLAATVAALAVLLDAGIPPDAAWLYAAEESEITVVRRISARIAAGAGPSESLHAVASRSAPQSAVRDLAAMWSVATAAGAPLAPALRSAAAALRDRAGIAREVEVALSGPRATTRLVAWLPVVGVGMAALLGVDMVGAFTGSAIGMSLLVGGMVLALAGRLWSGRMVRRASPSGGLAGVAEQLLAIALSSGLSVARSRAIVAEACSRCGLPVATDGTIDRVLALAARAGVPAIELLTASAIQRRRDAEADGRRAAAALGVRLMLPLALCVLPSFLLLGVAPVVLALISSTIGSLG